MEIRENANSGGYLSIPIHAPASSEQEATREPRLPQCVHFLVGTLMISDVLCMGEAS